MTVVKIIESLYARNKKGERPVAGEPGNVVGFPKVEVSA